MNTFWQWLMQANARRIFLCSIAALILVAAWWTWRVLSPLDNEVLAPQSAAKERAPRSGLGVPAFLNDELSLNVESPENVFRSQEQADSGQPKPQFRRGKSSEPPAQPKQATFSLTYKGTFQRTDGKVVALIENTKSRHAKFYAGGEEVCGFKVGEIAAKTVAITAPDGTVFNLNIRVPKTFEEDKHANN